MKKTPITPVRALLINPIYPQSVLTYENTIKRLGKKANYPPLGLLTIAALLPKTWDFKLVDRNARDVREDEWQWAEMVVLSALTLQKQDFHTQVKEAKRRGLPVAVGGPYVSSLPEDAGSSSAEYIIMDEGEATIPLFLQGLERGEQRGIYKMEERPDITLSPIPRYDLLNMNEYGNITLQFSRGCPFLCEFCSTITLYGGKPRAKMAKQMLNEVIYIYNLGYRGGIFIVDDNFIGNKRSAKQFLLELKQWVKEQSSPFHFLTEASLDLALEPELMDLMVESNFKFVLLGMETPDEESLLLIKKNQNTRIPLGQSADKIQRAGLSIMASFILGFDGEKQGAGQRVVDFVNRNAIPTVFLSLLQALPTTPLWNRLEKEKRLISSAVRSLDTDQFRPMNFTTIRPAKEIIAEYIDAHRQLYAPKIYLNRIFRHSMMLKFKANSSIKNMGWQEIKLRATKFNWQIITFGLYVFWQHGVVFKTRVNFWRYFFSILIKKPKALMPFVFNCSLFEHFEANYLFLREKMKPFL